MRFSLKSSIMCYGLIAPIIALTTACGPEKKVRPATVSLETYVQQAHARTSASKTPSSPGSLFSARAEGQNLFSDFKARQIDDILTIRVVETTAADSTADSSSSGKSNLSNSAEAMFGLEKRLTNLPNMVSAKGSKSFSGQGSTTRKTGLTTTLTARVVDQLPNGNLVIEGTREVLINNENQEITITGVVRPKDIAADNSILSTSIASLQVDLRGKGLVSKSLQPGWLWRILNGIMPF